MALSGITTQGWSIDEDIRGCVEFGYGGLGVWRYKLDEVHIEELAKKLLAHKLAVTNLCYAGEFTRDFDRAVADGEKALQIAETLRAQSLLVISGPIAGFTREKAYDQVVRGLSALAPAAKARGVPLALEALHPMDMTQWTVIPTLDTALDVIERVHSEWVGVMLDAYNTWWDPHLEEAILRAGSRILNVQIADWRNPTRSFTDRTVPGRGVIPWERFIRTVEAAGYHGCYDLEIFSEELWAGNYRDILAETASWFDQLEG